MRKFLLSFVTAYFTFLQVAYATSNGEYVEHKFTGQNFSGEYVCKGKNESVGDYEVFVTLKLNKISSNAKFGVYDFSTETLNNVTYYGQAVANGNRMALTFKLSDARNVEFSTGVGEFKKIGNRRWAFNNTYYEPDDSGGTYGTEYCAMKKPFLPPTKTVKKSKNTSVK